MPIMNGFELYKEIRKSDDRVKICFITAYEMDNNDFVKSFPTMTLWHFIKKPISLDKLAKELRERLLMNMSIPCQQLHICEPKGYN